MPKLRDGDLDWREVEGEVVALDNRRGVYLSVNATGTALWPLLVEGAPHDALVARLQETFGIDAERAGADVDAFVGDLAGRDLLDPGAV
jgi:hypothetical protein